MEECTCLEAMINLTKRLFVSNHLIPLFYLTSWGLGRASVCDCGTPWTFLLPFFIVRILIYLYNMICKNKKVREKSRECHNHKPQPFPDTKRKRKPTNPNKYKSNKRTKSTKISSLFPKRGNRNAKRTEKHKNKMTQGKT